MWCWTSTSLWSGVEWNVKVGGWVGWWLARMTPFVELDLQF